MSHLQNDSNLIWLDLEMTGLDPNCCKIIEIATIITDSQLNILAEGPSIAIHQDPQALKSMEKWSRDTHTKSGLLKRVESSTIEIRQAEEMTLEFIRHYCPERTSPLCGNSIGHDRRFLERYMPTLFEYLHYRNVDVSTLKELVRRWYPNGPPPPMKKGNHLALDDIRESINELIFYRNYYFVKQ
ncbi:MAG: oligoribonuclease [Candidatus Manganitrophus sp.]|nr:oligoribonuclease [Candidatus Manganitrophus sp.]